MRAPCLLFALFLATCLRLSALELTEGITRIEIESLVGKPISVLQRGDKTVLVYPKKGRAEFVGGRLVYFERIEVLDTKPPAPAKVPASPTPTPAPAVATTPAAPVASVAAPPATGKAKPTLAPAVAPKAPAPASPASVEAEYQDDSPDDSSSSEDLPKLTPEQRARIAKQQAEMAKLQEKMLNGEPLSSQGSSASEPTNPWLVMLIQSLFKIPITVVVLKLAFKWSDVDADWSQMWLPAAVDTLVRFSVQAIAQAAWGLDMLFYVDEALAFFALLYTLLKTTHACTLPRAVGVAFAAKLASVVVWAILSVFILGLLFSNAHS